MIITFADLHIHIGRTFEDQPVKISASSSLTIPNILHTAINVKGIQMIGVIDCHVPAVIEELEELIEKGELIEHKDGGLINEDGCLILGSEIEIYDDNCRGPIHVLVFFPDLHKMKQFSKWLKERMTNYHLSSQRYYGQAKDLQRKTKELKGLFVIAHAFTPFKSLYGKGVHTSMKEVFQPELIDAIELGLSCDTSMADQLGELAAYPFLSNSDAHSLEKIGREYQSIKLEELSFQELALALREEGERKIMSNFGLAPQLGKYYRTCCSKCGTLMKDYEDSRCPNCEKGRTVKGVSNRIKELSDVKGKLENTRPPYVHHVPLDFIPGVGPGRLKKLRERFGTDMDVIHKKGRDELSEVLPVQIVDKIIDSRNGKIVFKEGGGGHYGKLR